MIRVCDFKLKTLRFAELSEAVQKEVLQSVSISSHREGLRGADRRPERLWQGRGECIRVSLRRTGQVWIHALLNLESSTEIEFIKAIDKQRNFVSISSAAEVK